MENYVLVRPEHLNHHGFLFGGRFFFIPLPLRERLG